MIGAVIVCAATAWSIRMVWQAPFFTGARWRAVAGGRGSGSAGEFRSVERLKANRPRPRWGRYAENLKAAGLNSLWWTGSSATALTVAVEPLFSEPDLMFALRWTIHHAHNLYLLFDRSKDT
jgi:hypothetical protein